MDSFDDQQGIPLEELWPRITEALNQSLQQNHESHPDGAPRYQFEFSAKEEMNAFAYELGGVCIIQVTELLRDRFWELSFALSCSDPIKKRFNATTLQDRQMLQVELFSTLLGFVVGHEYGHHSLKHRRTRKEPFYEDHAQAQQGSIEEQGQEIHADGLAVYFGIAGLIAGDRRLLIKNSFQDNPTDECLLSLYITGVAMFFFLTPPPVFDPSTIGTLTHPPAAVRMNFIMYHVQRWCEESRRNLLPCLTLPLFQELTKEVRDMLLPGSGPGWPDQAFNNTPEGTAYRKKLAAVYDALQKG